MWREFLREKILIERSFEVFSVFILIFLLFFDLVDERVYLFKLVLRPNIFLFSIGN